MRRTLAGFIALFAVGPALEAAVPQYAAAAPAIAESGPIEPGLAADCSDADWLLFETCLWDKLNRPYGDHVCDVRKKFDLLAGVYIAECHRRSGPPVSLSAPRCAGIWENGELRPYLEHERPLMMLCVRVAVDDGWHCRTEGPRGLEVERFYRGNCHEHPLPTPTPTSSNRYH